MRDFRFARRFSCATRESPGVPGLYPVGEGAGYDAAQMPLITSANVCCGLHAGGPSEIAQTLLLADKHGVTIGALAKMSHVADDADIKSRFPAVSEGLWQAASPQIRNMASIGGNLMQRTRCPYFRDPENFPACNKRTPGSGCSAIGGVTRGHAVLGTSEACIATYPGDLAVALVAFDAIVHLGERRVSVDDFFLPPGTRPDKEHAIEPTEMITAIGIPASALPSASTYLKSATAIL
jgi:xanthine dehydrogenase YagS FAD-binding subunit